MKLEVISWKHTKLFYLSLQFLRTCFYLSNNIVILCVCVCVFVDIVAIWLFNILIANVKYFRYEENSISYNLEIQPLCLILLPEKIESTILIGDFIYGHTTISALCLI
jgi:hypothetical protein